MLAIACSVGLLLPLLGSVGIGAADGGAEDAPVLILEAEEGKRGGNASVSGGKVGNIGKNGGTVEGTVTFSDLSLPYDGEYRLKVWYLSGSDDRYFQLTTNYGKYKLDCPSTGSFDTVGFVEIGVDLQSGGSLKVGSDWYGPDLDKIEIYATQQPVFPDREYTNPDTQSWEDYMTLDLNNGTYSVLYGGKTVLKNARAEVKLGDDMISSDDFAKHSVTEDKAKGCLRFIHTEHPRFGGEMVQTFYQKEGYLLTEAELTGKAGEVISTNYISPVAVYADSVGVDNGVLVQIPFDNDMWCEPAFIAAADLQRETTSYEVAAYYNATGGAGLVIGSVSHDTWKSGITVTAHRGQLKGLALYGGVADSMTRDSSPHGAVSGETVGSPLTFIGYFEDWREGLTAYGKANAEVVPPKASTNDVPFGFNSWGTLQSSVKYSDMITVSDYVKEHLQEAWEADGGAVYVNIDSYWDFITHNDPDCKMDLRSALKSFVKHCKKNGQKAGVYFTPFTAWQGDEAGLKSTNISGTKYSFYDAAIRKSDGSGLYGKLDGGYALDPTHPGTIKRLEDQLKYFIDLGFEYIKLDFMTHGAVEGQHYDPTITTGMQAYNYGMAKIAEICDGKMYVNLSIAPLFPYQYADGRRISCDAFSSLDNTMHVLSHLTACFWEQEIYPHPDPDHLVVTGVSEGVARCRVTAGVITGGSILVGDNLTSLTSIEAKRIQKMYGNKDVIAVAKLGKSFTPYSVTAGQKCADAYWYVDGDAVYLAVFNFETQKATRSFDLSSLTEALPADAIAKELWSGDDLKLEGMTLSCTLRGQDAMLIRIGSPVVEAPSTDPDAPEAPNNAAPDAPVDGGDRSPEKLPWGWIAAGGAASVLAAVALTVAVNKKRKKK